MVESPRGHGHDPNGISCIMVKSLGDMVDLSLVPRRHASASPPPLHSACLIIAFPDSRPQRTSAPDLPSMATTSTQPSTPITVTLLDD
jgi:hypothetical protein